MQQEHSLARVAGYREAVQSMAQGRFEVDIPAGTMDDIGRLGEDLTQLAAILARKFEEIGKLQEIAEEVTAGLFLDDVLGRVYDSFRPLIPYDRIGCALLSNDGRTLTARWAKSDAPAQKIRVGYAAPMAASSLQQVIATGRPRILNDLEAYLAEHPDSESTRLIVAEGVRSNLTCPLKSMGKAVGFLFFSSRERNTYRDIHQGIFLQIAGQLSALIDKSRLYQQLYELNERLLLAERQLREQATHDALTGIYNRGAIEELLESELSRAQRTGRHLAIIMADVDHFKRINDTYGHVAGDQVLRQVAALLNSSIRGYDHVGRYGGEEFLIVLGDAALESAAEMAERIRAAVSREPVSQGGRALEVTISAGVAVAQDISNLKADRLVAEADAALYEAKRGGRNRVETRSI